MNIFNTLILIGKVIILISIILIFSLVNTKQEQLDKKKKYNNKPEDEDFSILEGYANKMKESGYFDGTCKIKISWPIYFIFNFLMYLLSAVIWLWKTFFQDPLSQLLKEKLGKIYVFFQKACSLIFKFYKLIIKWIFKIFRVLFKIIYNVIDIILRILLRILPTILKDILAYILAIPFLIFSPIYLYFSEFGKYFAVICWSEKGILEDVTSVFSFTTYMDIDELEKSASFEEDV